MTGWHFTLVDDDDFNSNDGTMLGGDEGEKIPYPDLSLLQDSDDPSRNKLAPAFVRPTYDVGGGLAPFVANAPPSTSPDFDTNLASLFAFDNEASEADPNFWTLYALSAYQDLLTKDLDPARDSKGKSEGVVAARGDEQTGKGFALYVEAQADYLARVRDSERRPIRCSPSPTVRSTWSGSSSGGCPRTAGSCPRATPSTAP
jgi:hypothetical protein